MNRPPGVPWYEVEVGAPDLARAGRRLLRDAAGRPDVAFLGTVASDGLPRIHPFIPAIVADHLWAFVILSPKQRDLERNGAYAIHSTLAPNDESFLAAGTALRVDAGEPRSSVSSAMPYDDIDDRHVLYEFLIERALWTTWTTPTTPVHMRWSPQPND